MWKHLSPGICCQLLHIWVWKAMQATSTRHHWQTSHTPLHPPIILATIHWYARKHATPLCMTFSLHNVIHAITTLSPNICIVAIMCILENILWSVLDTKVIVICFQIILVISHQWVSTELVFPRGKVFTQFHLDTKMPVRISIAKARRGDQSGGRRMW